MRQIGRVLEVWRYPVSSVAGEVAGALEMSATGVAGDRMFGLYDCATGYPAAPEQEPRWRRALKLSANSSDGPLPNLRFPDGKQFPLDHPSLARHLEAYFGFDVGIAAHSDGLPGNGGFPVIARRYAVSPLHLVTTGSLSTLERLVGLASIDRRRFRPSLLIETYAENFVENNWVGQRLHVGAVEVTVSERTRRCGMTLVAQHGLDEEPDVLRGIMRHNARSLGVYAAPHGSGVIKLGDPVYAGT